jgi:hydrophobe/amphiphile efflux-3 (HAE3) family protein
MGAAARRPLLVGVLVVVMAAAGLAGALTLRTSAGTNTLVSRQAATSQATDRNRALFGDDPIYVLVQESLPRLVLTADLNRMIGLEGCLAGNIPADAKPPGGADGPCARIAASHAVKYVFGPGTFINESANQISAQLTARLQQAQTTAQQQGAAAEKLARAKGQTAAQARAYGAKVRDLSSTTALVKLSQLGTQYGLSSSSLPQINNPTFVSQLVFADTGATATPKQRFSYLFPSKDSALIQVRLKEGLSDTQRTRAIGLIRQAVKMPEWKLHGTYAVTGAPVLVSDLTKAISGQLQLLLIAALLVMALVLGVVFRARMRLLPLAVALCAVAIVFGGLALVGQPMTMATIGVLPILVGLGVDYAIQLQSRVLEERDRRSTSFAQAARGAAHAGVPTIAIAAVATAAGFVAVALSPVPMVRQFGLVLVAGVLVAMLCALTLGTAVLVGVGDSPRTTPRWIARIGGAFAAAWRGAGELLAENGPAVRMRGWSTGAARTTMRRVVAHPGRVLAAAAVLAVVGWGLETQSGVESNVEKLVPQNLPAMRGLTALQRDSGVAGEVDLLVEGKDIARPAVMQWMAAYQQRVLKQNGYRPGHGCGQAELCPAFSLTDLLSGGTSKSQKQIDALLGAIPPYFSQGVLTPDHTAATVAFGLKVQGLDKQLDAVDTMRRELHPPPGITARVAGLPVLVAQANAQVASVGRRFLSLALSLLLVALVLLAAFRSARRALLPLVPIVLATGWSALVLAATRIPLNPMSVALGTLVVAISTEFSVLLAERYRRERGAGRSHRDALVRTYRSTGAAVTASGITAIAGFAVLMLSDIRMLRDFGAVTVVDLAVSLVGVLVVLPAVLTLVERRTVAASAGVRTAAAAGARPEATAT